MSRISLEESDLKRLFDALNDSVEPPEELVAKLFPSFMEKLAAGGKFDFEALNRIRIPTLEYAGKRQEGVILAGAVLLGQSAPLQILRTFGEPGEDGWRNLIVQGDNLQFLKTVFLNQDPLIKDKVKGKVKLIYIDPPFGTVDEYGGSGGEESYTAKIMGSEFIEGIRERLVFLREILSEEGCIFIRIDYHFGHYVKIVMDEVFGNNNFRNEIIVRRGQSKAGFFKQFEKINSIAVAYDTIFWYSKRPETRFLKISKDAPDDDRVNGKWMNLIKSKAYDRPTMKYELLGINKDDPWMWSKDRSFKAVDNYNKYIEFSRHTHESLEEYWNKTGRALEFVRRNNNQIQYWIPPRDQVLVDNNWLDITGYSHQTGYPTENSEELLFRTLQITEPDDLIFDCFGGSGTTAAVAYKLDRRWITCDFGKHAIYTMQKRLLNIADSKALGQEKPSKKYSLPPKPLAVVSVGAYDFSRVMDLRKNKEAYIAFVLALFGIPREEKDFAGKYRLDGIYAEKDGDPVEIFPVWEDDYLYHVRLDEDYLKQILIQSRGRIRGNYRIIVPETCTIVGDLTLKNQSGEPVSFKLLKFPYKILEEASRNFSLEEQPNSPDNINNLVSSVGFYFHDDVAVEARKTPGGLTLSRFSTPIVNREGKTYEGLEGLSLVLIDLNYDGKVFNLHKAVYGKEIGEDGGIGLEGVTEKTAVIAIDRHGNESKPVYMK